MESFTEILKKETNYDKQLKKYHKIYDEVKAYESFKEKVREEFGELSDEYIDMIQAKMLEKEIRKSTIFGCLALCGALIMSIVGLTAAAFVLMVGGILFFAPVFAAQILKIINDFE